jgi:hypothetical protein
VGSSDESPRLRTGGRRRWFVLAARCLVAAAAAIVALALIDLLRIRADLDAGHDDLRSLGIDNADQLATVTRAAHAHFERAASRASSSRWLVALSAVPGLGNQVEALREMTGAASEVGRLADEAGSAIDTALHGANKGPAGRLHLLDVIGEQLEHVRTALDNVDVGARGTLLPLLSGPRSELVDRIDKAKGELADGSRYVGALRRFLQGPSRGLVLAANNAEMTSGSGMPLGGGVATIAAGDISLGEFVQNDTTILLGHPIAPPGDLGALYWRMGLGYDFRGTTATPNFPVSGELAARMAAVTPAFGPVDGVFVVDPIVLKVILDVVGPVDVDGRTYTPDNVMFEVLNTNYLRFGDIGTQRSARAELQGDIARAAFDALSTRDVDLTKLLKGLSYAAKGRHLLAYSADRDLEDLWDEIDASGRLAEDGLLVAAENFDGDKLDFYLRPKVDVTVDRVQDGFLLNLAVTITNARREPTSRQIEGATPSEHFVLLDLHVPGSATRITSLDQPWEAVGDDPPMKVANVIYDVPLGATKTMRFQVVVPESQTSINILPSARFHPMEMTFNGTPFDDDYQRAVDISAIANDPPTRAPPWGWLVIGLLLLCVGAWRVAAQRVRLRPR